jgi:hypothetical protein
MRREITLTTLDTYVGRCTGADVAWADPEQLPHQTISRGCVRDVALTDAVNHIVGVGDYLKSQ